MPSGAKLARCHGSHRASRRCLPRTSLEALAGLKASLQRVTGTRHAAARPRARIVAVARMVLQHAALNRYEIDLFEVNEAYAAAVLRFMHHRGVPHEKVNVNGSAMALGHPRGPMAEKLQHAARRERGFLTGD